MEHSHRVVFTEGVFSPRNPVLGRLLGPDPGDPPSEVLAFIDQGLLDARPALEAEIEGYFSGLGPGVKLLGKPAVLPGGEAAKNNWDWVPKIWRAIHDAGLCRHSFIVAVGGGAFLDLVGFAAATAHRGIRLVRLPTTTLSQADGGVGVKNGVNFFGKKNWVGTFAVPHAVVNDPAFLHTLPEGQKRAGVIEAIKVSLIRDRSFFHYMEAHAGELALFEEGVLAEVVRRSAQAHLNHIATSGDPFEMGSARPLDFGHWVAHKLEQVSGFEIGHGDAVAIGMAVDLLYSARVGILEETVVERVLRLLETVGAPLFNEHLTAHDGAGDEIILKGLEEFREHLGGRLTITLVEAIGRGVEVHEMERGHILGALRSLCERAAATPAATTD